MICFKVKVNIRIIIHTLKLFSHLFEINDGARAKRDTVKYPNSYFIKKGLTFARPSWKYKIYLIYNELITNITHPIVISIPIITLAII